VHLREAGMDELTFGQPGFLQSNTLIPEDIAIPQPIISPRTVQPQTTSRYDFRMHRIPNPRIDFSELQRQQAVSY